MFLEQSLATLGFLNRRSRPSAPKIVLRNAHLATLAQPHDALTSTDANATGA
jgi:hypothetical protein